MRKLFLGLFILLVSVLPVVVASGTAVAAVDVFKTCGIKTYSAPGTNPSAPTVCTDVANQQTAGTNPVVGLLKIVLNILALTAGIAAILLIIINGLRLILSNGDSNGVNGARTGLIYSLIGVGIVVFAQVIVVFVLDRIQ